MWPEKYQLRKDITAMKKRRILRSRLIICNLDLRYFNMAIKN